MLAPIPGPPHVKRLDAIRADAVTFAHAWQDAKSEAGEKQTFWNELLAVFGQERRRVAVFEQLATRYSTGGHGFIDLLWPGYLAVEHKSRGSDLDTAMDQLVDYMAQLPQGELPRLLVVSDFEHFIVLDLQEDGKRTEFSLPELPHNIEVLGSLAGHAFFAHADDEEAVNLQATQLLGAVHDALAATGYDKHALRVLMTRLLFILFADDTEVWTRWAFEDYLTYYTDPDGHDVGPQLAQLFQVLNTPEDQLPTNLGQHLRSFAYIDGRLFADALPIPSCDADIRFALAWCCHFDWSRISPAIFGSMFQEVMTDAERRDLGAHYTTEENILKTLRPLMLDDLENQLDKAKTVNALERFHDYLATVRLFDPACGCGNFLVIAYRELRRLELDCLRRIRSLRVEAAKAEAARRQRAAKTGRVMEGQLSADVAIDSKVRVTCCYGIEIEEFPALIAQTAMYLIDHLANRELSAAFGHYYARFPIKESANIHHDNALRLDWASVITPAECTYLLGNPPYAGKKRRSDEQQEDMKLVFGKLKRAGTLDYVACWFRRGADFMQGTECRAAFVATSSITQGEQVQPLWQPLLNDGLRIDFAHRPFTWTSEASGAAGVHVVVIGFSMGKLTGPKRIFDVSATGAATETRARQINPYLTDAPSVLPSTRSSPLVSGIPECTFGSMPNDGGHLLLDDDEATVLRTDPAVAKFIRPLIDAPNLLEGRRRWCLWLAGAKPAEIVGPEAIRSRVEAVRNYRLASSRAETRSLADVPALFGEIRQPGTDYLCLPRHTSQRRSVIPMAFFSNDAIAHDSTLTIEGADLYLFALLSSQMFNAWVRTLAGRIRADFRLSSELVYNSFPWPTAEAVQRLAVTKAAQAVLDARSAHPNSTLAELYDPLATPSELVRAHGQLDRAVDELYGTRKFRADPDRLAVLIENYQTLAAPMAALASKRPTRRRRVASTNDGSS